MRMVTEPLTSSEVTMLTCPTSASRRSTLWMSMSLKSRLMRRPVYTCRRRPPWPAPDPSEVGVATAVCSGIDAPYAPTRCGGYERACTFGKSHAMVAPSRVTVGSPPAPASPSKFATTRTAPGSSGSV